MGPTIGRKYAGVLGIFVFLGLGGCASMSADECAVSDWQTVGFEDGARGHTADRLSSHRRACAKHGVAPDLPAYQSGRDEGLRQYCKPSRGFNLGSDGSRYNGVCPAHLEEDFVAAFNSGHRLYNLRSSVNTTNHEITSRRDELDNTEDRTVAAGIELVAAETTTENRILLLSELKDLSERKGQLEAEITTLIEERAIYQQQLIEYEAYIAGAQY